MRIDSARAYFEALAARGRESGLADAVGTWQFEIEGAGTWTVTADHGAVLVAEGAPANGSPRTKLHMSEDELLRLVRGDDHENLFMALLRGELEIEGELAFAHALHAILPVPDEWRVEP